MLSANQIGGLFRPQTLPSASELAAMYDGAASRWHRSLQRLGYPRAYADLFARLRALGFLRSLATGGRVLDCGIGAGDLSLALAGATVTPVQIAGVDISARMLDEARRVLALAQVEAQCQQGDVRELTFAEGSFDLVMSAHMLEHLAEPGMALQRMARWLRPGAPLLVIVSRRGPLDTCIRLRWRHRCFAVSQMMEWFAQAGLSQVECYNLAPAYRLPHWLGVACIGRRA